MFLASQSYFYFIKAIIDLAIDEIVSQTICKAMLIEKKVVINFFKLFLW